MNVLYHPSNTNVVADALNRLSMGSVAHVEGKKEKLAKDVHGLDPLGVFLMNISWDDLKVQNTSESSFLAYVNEKINDSIFLQLKGAFHQKRVKGSYQIGDSVFSY